MIGVTILFALKDEIKSQMDENAVRKHLANMVEAYRKVPGLKEKTFFMNPDNYDQGAFLVWESRELLDQYLKSDLYKTGVTDICQGKPRLESYVITATLKDGVVF
jgi:quinol monooxygenase YgiN